MRGLRAFMSSRYCFISGRVSGIGRGADGGSSARTCGEPSAARPNIVNRYRRMVVVPCGASRSAARFVADDDQPRGGADVEGRLLLGLLSGRVLDAHPDLELHVV